MIYITGDTHADFQDSMKIDFQYELHLMCGEIFE